VPQDCAADSQGGGIPIQSAPHQSSPSQASAPFIAGLCPVHEAIATVLRLTRLLGTVRRAHRTGLLAIYTFFCHGIIIITQLEGNLTLLDELEAEFERTAGAILQIKSIDYLLQDNPVLNNSIGF